MPNQPYVTRLPDGRYLAIELPDGSADLDPLTGELMLQPAAIHLLDRLQVLMSPLPANTTGNRVRILREALCFSREELAAALRIDATLLEECESGRTPVGGELRASLENLRQQAARSGVVLSDRALAL